MRTRLYVAVTVLLYATVFFLGMLVSLIAFLWGIHLSGAVDIVLRMLWRDPSYCCGVLAVSATVIPLLAAPQAEARGIAVRRWHVRTTVVTAGLMMATLTMCIVHCVQFGLFGERYLDSEFLLFLYWSELEGTALEVTFIVSLCVAWAAWYFVLRRFTTSRQPRQWISTLSLCLFMSSLGTIFVGLLCLLQAGSVVALFYGICAFLLSFAPSVFYFVSRLGERMLRSRPCADGMGGGDETERGAR